MPSRLATGFFRPDNPIGWLVRCKNRILVKPRFYLTKPKKYNTEEFDLIPVYEVKEISAASQ